MASRGTQRRALLGPGELDKVGGQKGRVVLLRTGGSSEQSHLEVCPAGAQSSR